MWWEETSLSDKISILKPVHKFKYPTSWYYNKPERTTAIFNEKIVEPEAKRYSEIISDTKEKYLNQMELRKSIREQERLQRMAEFDKSDLPF